jgi:adenylosuccinate synthase
MLALIQKYLIIWDMNKAVIDLGFGDAGKGVVTNWLAMQDSFALVTRYSGGQQAGHTVKKDGVHHIFSNFGSGGLNGNPTYWSEFCTVDPVGIINELETLQKKGFTPSLILHPKCPVTTSLEKKRNEFCYQDHGTCGVGVGLTWERESKFYSLLVEDLFHPKIMDIKIEMIEEAYHYKVSKVFRFCVEQLRKASNISVSADIFRFYRNIIFEGSQGLLLDQHYGFFPHVTRSNTGTTNILSMVDDVEVFLVTRGYQTRHGHGPMTNVGILPTLNVKNVETNVFNKFQGEFRVSLLDLDLLKYSIAKDQHINKHRDNLVITCLDQMENDFRVTHRGNISKFTDKIEFASFIGETLEVSKVWINCSEESNLEKVY